MKLNNIEFDDDEGIKNVTVTMTLQEALWIGKLAGKQKGASPHNTIYECLSGAVFDRFWEGGVDEALREFPVEIPSIRYED